MKIDVISLAREVFGQSAILPVPQLERFAALVQRATAAEWNFCPACGKRLGSAKDVHTCSPPAQ